MLIQKNLEAKIIERLTAALSAASVTGCTISGAWQTAQSGLVKWTEFPTTPAFLNVAVGTPGWKDYSTPVLDFSIRLALFIRIDSDPQGTTLAAVAEVVDQKLREWHNATYQAPFTELDVNGFATGGISVSAGSSPTVNSGLCSVAWDFTLSGQYAEIQTTNS